MQETIKSMKELTLNAKVIENCVKNDVDFLFDMNEQQYELQRHIFCRTCYVSTNKNQNETQIFLS